MSDEYSAAGNTGDSGRVSGNMRGLVVGAIGVVFGDLGTSPLYTLKEAFHGRAGMSPEPTVILGVLSLIAWTLTIVVTVKYIMLVMRADNRGEGGVMALLALARNGVRSPGRRRLVMLMALLGAALFFGDGVITPAISVLSAVEGLEVAAPGLTSWVVPLTVIALLALFQLQRFGTARVGALFGPIMIVWFSCLGIVGIWNIVQSPEVLLALNPWYAVQFLQAHGMASFVILGAVVLCITGVEALYADMGHFGRVPIRLAWYCFIMPGLLLNYFGQGAMLLRMPEAAHNPFYMAVPQWGLYPMIILATMATMIASQAVISGSFSVARHAIHLGFLPRMQIKHTSTEAIGQIYLPWVNRVLMIAVIATVLGFRSSNAMAGAYGVAVTGTMTIDTIMTMIVARQLWHWNRWLVVVVGAAFLLVDLTYFSANTLKIPYGGWFPFSLGLLIFTVMTTWRRGRELLARGLKQDSLALDPFITSITAHPPVGVSGTALFLTQYIDSVPHALLHNLKHNKVLHERNILLKVETLETPVAVGDERIELARVGGNFYTLVLRFGFAEDVNVPLALSECSTLDPPFSPEESTFFLSRESVVPSDRRHGMALWRDKLFTFMARNALPATAFFNIPGNRLIELGAQVEI